ncbi:sec14 cytosolic factor-like [Nymphaea colorata]|nr:sec14 cytosolic factor-like [Nymphaea colorata]
MAEVAPESAMEQMKAAVEKLGSSTEGETEGDLTRFLVARSMDPKKAARMFVQWKTWRAEIAPLGYIPEDEVLDELGSQKIFLQGPSRSGFAVFIILARKHFAPKDFLQLKRFVVHILDKTLMSCEGHAEKGKEKIVAILDLQKISLANIDVRSLIAGFQTLQDYYPERLAKVFIVSMPLIFVGAWKIVSAFLSKTTLDKVQIVKSEEGRAAMLKEIGEETLPVEYGGSAKLVPLQDVKLNYLPATTG